MESEKINIKSLVAREFKGAIQFGMVEHYDDNEELFSVLWSDGKLMYPVNEEIFTSMAKYYEQQGSRAHISHPNTKNWRI